MKIEYSAEFCEYTTTVKDVSLFYRRGGAPDAPLTLLIHGHTQTSDMWAPLANALVRDNRQVIAVDMHGLGRSSTIDGGIPKKKLQLIFGILSTTFVQIICLFQLLVTISVYSRPILMLHNFVMMSTD